MSITVVLLSGQTLEEFRGRVTCSEEEDSRRKLHFVGEINCILIKVDR